MQPLSLNYPVFCVNSKFQQCRVTNVLRGRRGRHQKFRYAMFATEAFDSAESALLRPRRTGGNWPIRQHFFPLDQFCRFLLVFRNVEECSCLRCSSQSLLSFSGGYSAAAATASGTFIQASVTPLLCSPVPFLTAIFRWLNGGSHDVQPEITGFWSASCHRYQRLLPDGASLQRYVRRLAHGWRWLQSLHERSLRPNAGRNGDDRKPDNIRSARCRNIAAGADRSATGVLSLLYRSL